MSFFALLKFKCVGLSRRRLWSKINPSCVSMWTGSRGWKLALQQLRGSCTAHGLSPEGQELFSGAEPPPPEGLLVPFLVVVAQATACKPFIQDTGLAWTGPLGTVVHIAGRGVSHGAGGLGRTGSTPFLFLELQRARILGPWFQTACI